MSKLEKFEIDCLIIGGGVSGVAIAREISPSFKSIFLIERNKIIGEETSSRNSEVIHSGVYYDKDSLKSKLCIQGKELLYNFLIERDIEFNRCGKFIVSTCSEESEQLYRIYKNGLDCGVDDIFYDNTLKTEYPFINYQESIFSPSTGIFDSHSYIRALSSDFEVQGGNILLGNEVIDINHSSKGFEVLISDNNIKNQFIVHCRTLINAAGTKAAEIANQIRQKEIYLPEYIKGEYYTYQGKEKLNHLIYPTPTKNSLGLHATIDLGKGIRFGPSAYEVNQIDYSVSLNQKKQFASAVQSYWPSIKEEDLTPGYSGIRPRVKNLDDFLIDSGEIDDDRFVNVLGYASPGLTSSLAMAIEVSNHIN